jgi:outer membrane beta-barrel protein
MTTVTNRRSGTRRACIALTAAAVAVFAQAAGAENLLPRDEGFMKEPKSVAYRRYALDGKNDFGVFGSFSMKNKLTEHVGAAVSFDKQFSEYLSLDVFVGGGYGGLTNLALNVRDKWRATSNPGTDLADAGALLATGQLGLRFTPIYGKMSLSSELSVHFNAYFVGGVGGALIQYNSVLTCAVNIPSSSTKCPGDNFRKETSPNVAFNVGGGFRFWITDHWSARVEVRDVIFPDRFYEKVVFKTPVGSGQLSANAGISQVPLVLVGVGFIL